MNDPATTAAHAAAAVLAQLGPGAADQVDVAVGAYVWGEALVQGLLPRLRAGGFRGRIILGGPQISYAPAGLESLYPDADVFVRGYGEAALGALAVTPGKPEIRGVHYAGEVDRVETADVDLEALPSPWLDGAGPAPGAFVRWETQRGCPYRCSFCQHREAGARLDRRRLASERLDREIDLFLAAGVRDIAVLDPIFNLGRDAVRILERFADAGFTGRLSLQVRAETLTPAFLDAAARVHARLELGLQTIHAAESLAIDRGNQLPKVDRALSMIRARGLDHEVSLISGLPHQTLASFEASVGWCLERRVPVIKAFPLMLLRGTALEGERDRWGPVDSGGPMPMVVSVEFVLARGRARDGPALGRAQGHRGPAPRDPGGAPADRRRAAGEKEPDRGRWMPGVPHPAAARPLLEGEGSASARRPEVPLA